ncbi:protein FAR1-RELATED SEQUENCE [Citrus sinensis]|nr:protein FAR1-RELATED SEQUENCE [Citrus sinensis]
MRRASLELAGTAVGLGVSVRLCQAQFERTSSTSARTARNSFCTKVRKLSSSSWNARNSPRRESAWSYMRALVATVNSPYWPSRPPTRSSNVSRVSWTAAIDVSSVATRGSNASIEGALDLPRDFGCLRPPSSRPRACSCTSAPSAPSCNVLEGLANVYELVCVWVQTVAPIPLVTGGKADSRSSNMLKLKPVVKLKSEDRLENVFWADRRSKAAYKYFGNVVTFDTTYLTNKYDMSFALFVGVNHHGQSILLGCDKAMQKAIEHVFPTTRHRWCLWHIMKKVPEKLWAFKERESIISLLLSVVYDSLSPAAFEKDWNDMITTYDLWDNAWLNGLYDESESLGQGKKKNFEVVFDETECEVSSICSKFQFRGILCRHALSVLIRHDTEILPEMYILSRWRKYVKRCYSKVKVSYSMQNLSIQQERYDKMCTDFTEVANIAADNESSYKFVLDWINKTMKDLPKQIRCASVETTAIGEDLQENASASFEMTNEVSTQQSNIQQSNMTMGKDREGSGSVRRAGSREGAFGNVREREVGEARRKLCGSFWKREGERSW